jgi:hypothetical protein
MSRAVCFFLISLFFTSHQAQAVTRGFFLGMGDRGIITINPSGYGTGVDSDSQVLFDAMDVPIQDSFLGKGKAIVTDNKELNFVCANRGDQGHQCSITINAGKEGRVSKSKGIIGYVVKGEKAAALTKLFFKNNQNGFYFESLEGSLKIWARPDLFQIQFLGAAN